MGTKTEPAEGRLTQGQSKSGPKQSWRELSPGKELGRQGGTQPAALTAPPNSARFRSVPPIPVPLRSGLKNNFFKEKKKIHHPTEDTPPQHVWGDAGRSTCWIHGNTRNRKRGWFGPRLPGQGPCGFRCRHPTSRRPHPSSSARRFSAASSHQPRLRTTDGCRQEWAGRWWGRGPRCQRPPPLQRGVSELRGLLWTGPASVCPSLLSCPGRCTLDATLTVCVAVRGCADGGRAGGQQVCPPPGEKRFKMLGPKRRTLPALR